MTDDDMPFQRKEGNGSSLDEAMWLSGRSRSVGSPRPAAVPSHCDFSLLF